MHTAEWLRQLLEPALAATLNNDPAATAAASSALTALASLEGLCPGSLQTMMLQACLPPHLCIHCLADPLPLPGMPPSCPAVLLQALTLHMNTHIKAK